MLKLYISAILLVLTQAAVAQLPVLDRAKAFLGNNAWNSQELSNGRTVAGTLQPNGTFVRTCLII